MYLIWIFGVQINSIKQPIKGIPVGPGFVSHCWTSALNDHLVHGFVCFKDVQLTLTLRRKCVRRNLVYIPLHPKKTWSRNDVGSSRSTFFHQFLPTWEPNSVSFQPFQYHPCLPIGIMFVSCGQANIPNSVPILVSNKTSSNSLSHKSPASGCPYKFRYKRNH